MRSWLTSPALSTAGALHGHVQTNLLLAIENWARAAPDRGSAVVPRDIGIDDRKRLPATRGGAHTSTAATCRYSPGEVDVHLDRNFDVLGDEAEGEGSEDEGSQDD